MISGGSESDHYSVNHRKETVIFGAALLYEETIESFGWLFVALKLQCPEAA